MIETLYKKLGRSEIQVSALGLGCWAIGGPFWEGNDALGWGNVSDEESIKAIHKGLDLGINFFDTSDVYGAGHSERILGKALSNIRKEVVIATKFGFKFDESSRQVKGSDASKEYIIKACEGSLDRLNTDYIDLYQFHLNDYDPAEAENVMDVLEDLVSQGKIRNYGWSTDYVEQARVFEKGVNCTSIQFQNNVLDTATDLVELCSQSNLAGINRGPLAMGLLTGKYNNKSNFAVDDVRGSNSPGWMEYFNKGKVNSEWRNKLDAINEILQCNGRTLAQGALAWLWAKSKNNIPIPGFKNIDQVEENCSAMNFGPLKKDQLLEIDRILGR
jgi:aryl-alcohol dehydrogenase-like predicted oxidoreductase